MLLFIDLIGLHTKDLKWNQMLMRTVIVFIAALAFIRLSGLEQIKSMRHEPDGTISVVKKDKPVHKMKQ